MEKYLAGWREITGILGYFSRSVLFNIFSNDAGTKENKEM